MRGRFDASLLALVLGGCSATGLLADLTADPSIANARDIPYAPGARHALDVYRPSPAGAPRPVVVFFYGGGWDAGAKQDYRFVGQTLAAEGYVAVIPEYRLYPAVRYPAFLQTTPSPCAGRGNMPPTTEVTPPSCF